MAFADNFTFARAGTEDWTDANGDTHMAGPNVPTFTWAGGVAQGLQVLMVDGVVVDSAQVKPASLAAADVVAGQAWTILHAWTPAGGSFTRHAIYTRDPQVAIDAALAQPGCHAALQVMPDFLHNWGGYVWVQSVRWDIVQA